MIQEFSMKRIIALIWVMLICIFSASCRDYRKENPSSYTPKPIEGVTLEVTADEEILAYQIISNTIEIQIYNPSIDYITIERLLDGQWYKVKRDYGIQGLGGTVTPDQSFSFSFKWVETYRTVGKGKYRMILKYVKTEDVDKGIYYNFYNASAEFTLN